MSQILETTKYVVKNSDHVKIDQEKLREFAISFDHANIQHWLNASPYDLKQLSEKDRIVFILVFNSISFSYWGNPKWTIEYKGKNYDGAWGMIVALSRAIEEGKPILDPKYRSGVSFDEFKGMFRGNTEIPLIAERHRIFQETGRVLVEKFNSDFGMMVQSANRDVNQLLDLLMTNFPSFDDHAYYKDHEVFFYKRAQLLISDIYQLFDHRGYGDFMNADQITACADYKLPQALRKFGVLIYDTNLSKKVDSRVEIPPASSEEVEIRANTIWAIEMIKEQVRTRLPGIMSMDINDHVWLYTQTKYPDDKPYHLSRTTAY